jgi:hypothetical protein
MAIARTASGMRAQGREMLRDTWGRVGQHSSPVFSQVTAFLVAYPLWVQGVYYVLTGLWPLLNLNSFQAVTGPKHDLWLVQTVGVLVFVIGATLCLAAYRRHSTAEIVCLAVASAVGLMGIDVVFVMQRVISPVYLLDAVAEVGLVALWVYGWRAQSRTTPPVATPVPMGTRPPLRP